MSARTAASRRARTTGNARDAAAGTATPPDAGRASVSRRPAARRTERVDFRAARVLVVGDAMLDRYWFGDVERISPEAPVPVVRVRQLQERLGGAANVARNVASLGAHATLVAIVGNDPPGDLIERMARDLGVDTQLARDSDLPTTIKLRVIGRQQQLLRIDFEESPGAAALASKLRAVQAAIEACDIMVLSDYGK